MSSRVLLDTGVLGLIVQPSRKPEPRRCKEWLRTVLQSGSEVFIPEIADYELRRELLHMEFADSVTRLDQLKALVQYLPITTDAMLRAAELWADARKQGAPTADAKALDGDVILAAQASVLPASGQPAVIATTNVAHLARYVDAKRWEDIH